MKLGKNWIFLGVINFDDEILKIKLKKYLFLLINEWYVKSSYVCIF